MCMRNPQHTYNLSCKQIEYDSTIDPDNLDQFKPKTIISWVPIEVAATKEAAEHEALTEKEDAEAFIDSPPVYTNTIYTIYSEEQSAPTYSEKDGLPLPVTAQLASKSNKFAQISKSYPRMSKLVESHPRLGRIIESKYTRAGFYVMLSFLIASYVFGIPIIPGHFISWGCT